MKEYILLAVAMFIAGTAKAQEKEWLPPPPCWFFNDTDEYLYGHASVSTALLTEHDGFFLIEHESGKWKDANGKYHFSITEHSFIEYLAYQRAIEHLSIKMPSRFRVLRSSTSYENLQELERAYEEAKQKFREDFDFDFRESYSRELERLQDANRYAEIICVEERIERHEGRENTIVYVTVRYSIKERAEREKKQEEIRQRLLEVFKEHDNKE